MIPFNKPYIGKQEKVYLAQALQNDKLCGDGPFTQQCQSWLENSIGCKKALLTHSCTGALEMMALLLDIKPGDEIIMPSFTFVSTANAFVLRGGVPVFVDIRKDTLNIDETKIAAAITPKTKAIMVVHYAGVGCEMDSIMTIAKQHNLFVLEDAAQGIVAEYRNKPLGTIGHLGAFSFHETKNIQCGEGGALLINDQRFIDQAEIIREKGTNRRQFLNGLVDKYTWIDVGSSYLPSELNAAFLLAQLENAKNITERRLSIWHSYDKALQVDGLHRPVIPHECSQNAHLYYLLLATAAQRDAMLQQLHAQAIQATFHYIPLHNSPAGQKFGRSHGDLKNTVELSSRLIRLPFWLGVESQQNVIVDRVLQLIK